MAGPLRRRGALSRLFKPFVFVLCLLPVSILAYDFWTENLSVNPLDDITDTTGTWTLRFVVITLAITPVRKVTGWADVARLRRMTGLYAFFYGSLHLFTYLYFDKFFEWAEILGDIPQRRFILAGFSAWLLMLPLALTSTDRMTRLLGGKRWKNLHRSVYVVGILGVIHYYWLVKFDTRRPLIYAGIVAVLLGYRFVDWQVRRRKGAKASSKAEGGPPKDSKPAVTSAP